MVKTTVISLALAVSLGISALVVAQSAPSQAFSPSGNASSSQTDATSANATSDRQVIKPGDRTCIRDTGSLIPAKKGQCLQGVAGRSYSRQDLLNTGAASNAQALRMLDPSIH